MSADAVGVVRDDEGEDLFPSPQRFRFQNGWLRDLAVPGRDPHEQFHHLYLEYGGGREE